MRDRKLLMVIALFLLLVPSCSPGGVAFGGPQSAGKQAFEQWAQQVGMPYRDVRYETLSDDGTYATVRIVAYLREAAEVDWMENEAEIKCRKVGNRWQCDQWMFFQEVEPTPTPPPTPTPRPTPPSGLVTEVVLSPDLPSDEPVDPQAVHATGLIMQARLNGLNISPTYFELIDDQILLFLPPITNFEATMKVVSGTGILEFIHAEEYLLPPGALVQTTFSFGPTPGPEERVFGTIMTGLYLRSVNLTVDDYNQIQIAFALRGEGPRILADYTAENVGQVMCIVLDKEVVSCATIKDVISSGEVLLSREGGFTTAEANGIVVQLSYGVLPIPLRILSVMPCSDPEATCPSSD